MDTVLKKAIKKIPGIMYGLILIVIFFSFLADGFVTPYNLLNILKDSSVLVIVSFGMTITILAGKIDMSIGSVMSLSGVVTGLLLHKDVSMLLAILAGLVVGGLIGALNGYFIGYQRFDFWIVTFATMGIAQGLALASTNGNVVPGFSDAFRFLGDGKVCGIFFMIWLTLLLSLMIFYLMHRTKLGSDIYSIGGSEQCARLSGIKVTDKYLKMFIISGVLAAFGGILLASKSNSASPIGGLGYEFDAIAAVLIGGTPFEGGRGGVTGTIIGAVLIVVLKNGLNMLGLTPPVQFTIIGFIIMLTIIIDVLNEKRILREELRRR